MYARNTAHSINYENLAKCYAHRAQVKEFYYSFCFTYIFAYMRYLLVRSLYYQSSILQHMCALEHIYIYISRRRRRRELIIAFVCEYHCVCVKI